MSEKISKEAYGTADELIRSLLRAGHDYSNKREEIAYDFDNYLYMGHWDHTTDFDDMPNLRIIHEKHWSQHMDEDADDYPTWEAMVCECNYTDSHCVWIED